ncbi:saccharopine dehydrogenase NADP-binding domain-containing protein [Elioraea tepida]|uniref:Saccharopine dehydrogenase NADP-binding domain-containing protein n=1 Tax=Elioraea tepida TaxID=2843330 RepID=A0A975U0A7_9PROT|nr:saccharopine dehydrogenase C-terminal domain-containing protein [Elioraea tepida]QXM23986.1 saccharopine dehydrogenase NADP-binding domain-containing protein [Elioraea tepida]
MAEWKTHARFPGPIVMVGFGSIGRGTLPLILRHIDAPRERMVVIDPDDSGRWIAEKEGIRFRKLALTRENLRSELEPLLGRGGFLVNLSVEVSSVALIELCRQWNALYLDTCIEPWPGGYTDPSLSMSQRSNYALRESARALRRPGHDDPTALIAHGANPGMVSHFVKQALVNLAEALGKDTTAPTTQEGWARLARDLGVKGIHIAERDTQRSDRPKEQGEFVNTWSIEGFLSEGMQPAELGFGTHEKALPPEGRRHEFGCDAAIYLTRPGCATRVRTWVPTAGPQIGWLITHNESISIADYLTLREGGKVVYRPTCHYAYHPCDDTVLSLHEFQGRAFERQPRTRLMNDEIVEGIDELGVLLYGHARNAYWFGSQLSIAEARRLAPYQNATGLQVTSAVLAGMVWTIENPRSGVVDADEIDWRRCLEVQLPYLGPVVGAYTSWTPLTGRPGLFPEDVDLEDPWQFRNVIVR